MAVGRIVKVAGLAWLVLAVLAVVVQLANRKPAVDLAAENAAANERLRAMAQRRAEQPPPKRSAIVGVDPDPPELVARAKRLVEAFEKRGALRRWTCVGNEAYMPEVIWHTLDVDGKRGITGALAILCHAENSGRRMTMKSLQTGKTLGSISGNDFEVE